MANFNPEDLKAVDTGNFVPIANKFGGYLKSSFGDWNFEDVTAFKLTREAKDQYGYTPYNVTLKLSSGEEISLKQRLGETYTGKNVSPSGKIVVQVDERPYSENKGKMEISEYVPAESRAYEAKIRAEAPSKFADYSEWDSRWGMRLYRFRNPSQGRNTGLEGDIPFTGRTSYGTRADQLFVNGFPVDDSGARITIGGSDPNYGTIGSIIVPVDYEKNPMWTPILAPGQNLEGQTYRGQGDTYGVYGPSTGTETGTVTPSRTYTSKDGLEFTDQMAFATYQTGLMAEARAKTEAERLAAEAEAKAAQAEFEKKFKAENAAISLTALFEKYGLGTLAPKVKELAIAGYSDDTITIQLAETPEYKQRFRANEDRRKKGLAVLSPSEYINLEDRYRQILKSYGLKQFDNDEYVTQFLSNNVSPTELTSRVETAVNRVQNADPLILDTLRSYYNIPEINLVAYMLDPEKEEPALLRQVQAAEIGAAARVQGLTAGKPVAEQLAAQGITQAQAQKGYATIAGILPEATKLSQIYSDALDQYGQAEAEQEVFNSLASAQRKRRALTEREIATFSGASGLGRTSLDQKSRGSF